PAKCQSRGGNPRSPADRLRTRRDGARPRAPAVLLPRVDVEPLERPQEFRALQPQRRRPAPPLVRPPPLEVQLLPLDPAPPLARPRVEVLPRADLDPVPLLLYCQPRPAQASLE